MANNNVTFVINAIGNAQGKIESITQATAVANVTVNKFQANIAKLRDAGLAFDAINNSIGRLTGAMNACQDVYNIQSQAEKRLETVMRQRIGASDEQINSIKQLATAQQKLGIIGDEIQLSGAQQLATFINQKDSIDTLLPAMNNLLAQQRGINATEGDAVNIGNLMGKVMQGQTAALTRVGITFTEAQEKVLKYGTEQQRAAMLAQVITDNVGNMNEALASTPEGQLKQVTNSVGDMRERIGALWVQLQNRLLPVMQTLMSKVDTVLTFFEEHKTLITVIGAALLGLVVVVKSMSFALTAYQIVISAASAATAIWSGIQRVFNLIMSMNPIALVVIGIVALIAVIALVCSKITGWGSLWKGVVGFMKYSFYSFVDAIKLYFSTYINGFLIGLDKIKLGWYKFKEAAGLGDSNENQAAIAKINADVEARQKAIADGAKAVADNAKKANESLGGIEMGWDKSKNVSEATAGVKAKLGINDQMQASVTGSGTTGTAEGSATGKSTEAVATGGSRSTNVTISLKNLVEKIVFEGTTSENKSEIERNLAEAMFRVLNMAQSSIG